MLSMSEVFSWLNYDDVPHLSSPNLLTLIQIQDKRIPQDHREAGIKSMRISSETCQDKNEILEIKVTLAKIKFDTGDYNSARLDLSEAVERYPTASHRLGVAKWMLGIVLWRMMENEAAYANWFKAREIFAGITQLKVKAQAAEQVRWYNERMEQMRLDMTCTAEEAFHWLNALSPSHLTQTANALSTELKQQIQKKQFPLAYEISNRLAKLSRNRLDSTETAETWAVIGLAAYQMGVARLAIDYWLRGVSSFTPWSHEQAVCRWMMGTAQWQIQTEYDNAMKSWREAIETFKDLQLAADHANDSGRKDWYAARIPTMEKALGTTIKEKIVLSR